MTNNKDLYEPFIIDEATSFESYITHMRKPYTWGGEPEISAAAETLSRVIHVYSPTGGSLSQVSEYYPSTSAVNGSTSADKSADLIENKERIYLLFHGLGHYDVLLPSTYADASSNIRSKL